MTEVVSAFSFYAKKETEASKVVKEEKKSSHHSESSKKSSNNTDSSRKSSHNSDSSKKSSHNPGSSRESSHNIDSSKKSSHNPDSSRKSSHNIDSSKKSQKRKRSSATPIKPEPDSSKKSKSLPSKSPKPEIKHDRSHSSSEHKKSTSAHSSTESLSKSQKKKQKVRVKKEPGSNIELNHSSQNGVHNMKYELIQNGDYSSDGSSDGSSPMVKVEGIKKLKNKIPISSKSVDRTDLFSWVISPVDEFKFRTENWELRPIHVKRHCSNYYSSLISCEKINLILRQKKLFFGKNLDVTSYTNGKRETHNPGGRANAPLVWDFYRNGCSVRILNPQTFFRKVHYLNSELQEYFGCFVGANVYLTPPGTQGFAPHYDDIEAFVLQIEGKKKWKLYAPLTQDDILPRVSSKNFTEDELGPMIMEVVLEPGDLLYFPRGTVHQASALEDSHSLHITLSVYQRNSYADLLEKLLPAALSIAVEKNSAFRAGLPMHYLRHMGTAHSLLESDVRTNMVHTIENLMKKLVDYAPIDAACDQMGKGFMIDALPPFISDEEKILTVYGDGEIIDHKGNVGNTAEMEPDSRIRLIRYNAVRLVAEEEKIRLYYTVDNSLEYHGEEPQYLEVEESMVEGIELLIHTYPNFIAVEELPMNDQENRQLATVLWETGLLITEDPIGYMSD